MISVIIPAYNAAQFLEKCIKSILAQTFQDFEVIVIDDGSSDNTYAVCKKLSECDKRIKVIHKENEGVSVARNVGMDLATGEYLAFVDADDYVDLNYLQVLQNDMIEHNADISCCDFFEILHGAIVQFETPKVLHARMVEEKRDLLHDLTLGQECYGTCVWGKLIRTELAKKFRFRPLKFGEDQMFLFDLFSLNPKVYLNPYKGYYYVRNESSATMRENNYSISRCMDELLFRRTMLEELSVKDPLIERMFVEKYALSLHGFARAVVLCENTGLRNEHRKNIILWISQLDLSLLSKKTRMYLLLYRYAPFFYRYLLQLKHAKYK